MWVLFGENICKNERIGSCWGGAHIGGAPLDPPMISFSSGGWLAKCLVLAVAQFSLSPACAVTFIGLRGCCDVS